MNWDLEGLHIKGMYLDEIPVSGRVTLSRAKLGGSVEHTVMLDSTIEIYGRTTGRVIVKHKEITEILTSVTNL